jgi:integrase
MKFRTTHKRLASGRIKIYYYTVPGGTRFFDNMDHQLLAPFPEAFKRLHAETVESEPNGGKPEGACGKFIAEFIGSPNFSSKAKATRDGYAYSLQLARDSFGTASVKVIEDRRFRGKIIEWQHNCAKSSPRQADLNIQALSLALGYAHARGLLLHNPAANLPNVYERPDDKQPWSDAECDLFLAGATQSEFDAFMLARSTGLRRTDLAKITWSAFRDTHIEWLTHKGRGKRLVIIPLSDDAKSFLLALRERQGDCVTMLTGDRGKPVQPRRIGDLVNKRAAKLAIGRTIHNLRNTYATDLIRADFSDDDVAETLGWSINDVKHMKRIYVQREEINSAKISRLQQG